MPWFFCLLIGLAAVGYLLRPGRTRIVAPLILLVLVSGLGIRLWPGRFYAEKMLTNLALPLGLVWFALLLIIGWLFYCRRRIEGILVVGMWLFLSAAGNYATSGWLVKSLEEPYLDIAPSERGQFDIVCLLGGGAWVDRQFHPKLSQAGDRVVVAAELYRSGQTPKILCTGGDLRPAPNLPTVADMSAGVLADLGVPREAILLGPGLNTKTELIALESLVTEHGWERVGLVTSAWHMGRAERLARDAGVKIVPLPADFRTGAESDLPAIERIRRFSLISNASALEMTHATIKEYLARLVGR